MNQCFDWPILVLWFYFFFYLCLSNWFFQEKNCLMFIWSIGYFKADLCLQPGSPSSLCWVTQHGYAANDFAYGSNDSGVSGYFLCFLIYVHARIEFLSIWQIVWNLILVSTLNASTFHVNMHIIVVKVLATCYLCHSICKVHN